MQIKPFMHCAALGSVAHKSGKRNTPVLAVAGKRGRNLIARVCSWRYLSVFGGGIPVLEQKNYLSGKAMCRKHTLN